MCSIYINDVINDARVINILPQQGVPKNHF